MIVKAPTAKSRASAYAGIVCVLILYIVEGWFTPPAPTYASYILGVASIGFMFLARSIRQSEGLALAIPIQLKDKIAILANIEAYFALLSGASVFVALIAVRFNAEKIVQRGIFIGSVLIFALNAAVSYWVFRRYKTLLRNDATKN